MDTIHTDITALIRHYEGLISVFEKELLTLPEGTLHLHPIRGKTRFYHHLSHGDKHYLSAEKDTAMIQALAEKRFIKNSLCALRPNTKQLTRLANSYVPWDPYKCAKELPVAAAELIKNFDSKLFSADAAKWLSEPFTTNPLNPGNKIHLTSRGEYVRSKSELSIADALFIHGVPYKYECQLKLGNTEYYPDFHILRMRDSKLFYWEHFGLMGQPQYERNTDSKLKLYRENGICQWDNLIVTYDTPNGALDMQQINSIIAAFLN